MHTHRQPQTVNILIPMKEPKLRTDDQFVSETYIYGKFYTTLCHTKFVRGDSWQPPPRPCTSPSVIVQRFSHQLLPDQALLMPQCCITSRSYCISH